MQPRKRIVISIHGMRTDAPWQEACHEVFSPHFRYEPFRYEEFRHPIGAVIWVALDFIAALLLTTLLFCCYWLGWVQGTWRWSLLILLCLGIFFYCRYRAGKRREKVIDALAEFIDKQVKHDLPPHILAHSLGTYMFGVMLDRYPEFKVDRVILAGCVLRRAFPWGTLRRRFEIVRNEVGKWDWVALSASLLRPFVPQMGSAGIAKFKRVTGFVHDLDDPYKPWSACELGCVCGVNFPVGQPQIFNVVLKKQKHTYSAVLRRARVFWLPFFWNIPPGPYEAFKNACLRCYDLEKQGRDEELDAEAAALAGTCWWWTKGPLEGYVAKILKKRGIDDHDSVLVAIRQLWRIITAAVDGSSNEERALLHPTFAVLAAARWVVNEVTEGKRRGDGSSY